MASAGVRKNGLDNIRGHVVTRPVYLHAARRSAVVPRGGAFASLALHELALPVVMACLSDAGIAPNDVDDLIAGNALGAGGNPARVVALAAGLPNAVAGLTIDRQCVSGLDALLIGRDMIASGRADIVIAGGVESFSNRPYRAWQRDGKLVPYDQAPFTPWPDRDPLMHVAAEALAQTYGISRQAQDDWAIESHRKAKTAESVLRDEIVPLLGIETDPFARDLSPALCRRAPVLSGTITQANTSVAADAASFVVLSAHRGPVEMMDGVTLGGTPELPGIAPVDAIKVTLHRSGARLTDLTQAEIKEAYAVQAIACVKGAGLDPAIVNPNGGSLARGHPIGASGAILATRLFHDLRKNQGIGLAAIAAAGGLGTALLLKSV